MFKYLLLHYVLFSETVEKQKFIFYYREYLRKVIQVKIKKPSRRQFIITRGTGIRGLMRGMATPPPKVTRSY